MPKRHAIEQLVLRGRSVPPGLLVPFGPFGPFDPPGQPNPFDQPGPPGRSAARRSSVCGGSLVGGDDGGSVGRPHRAHPEALRHHYKTSPELLRRLHDQRQHRCDASRMTTTSPLAIRLIGLFGTAAVVAYAAFAALQIQVLNPLATVPGSTLREIHAAVGQSADTMGWGLMIVALLIGPLIAAAVALFGMRGLLRAGTVVMIMLALLALGSPAYFVASFPAGMTLADTFMVDGADHAPWANILHAVSLLAVVALAAVMIFQAVRAARDPETLAG